MRDLFTTTQTYVLPTEIHYIRPIVSCTEYMYCTMYVHNRAIVIIVTDITYYYYYIMVRYILNYYAKGE